jgi:hypothetical protein
MKPACPYTSGGPVDAMAACPGFSPALSAVIESSAGATVELFTCRQLAVRLDRGRIANLCGHPGGIPVIDSPPNLPVRRRAA